MMCLMVGWKEILLLLVRVVRVGLVFGFFGRRFFEDVLVVVGFWGIEGWMFLRVS